METPILKLLQDLLTDRGVSFRQIHHSPTRTSEESAAARGERLEVGGKALVLKVDDTFGLFVLSASRTLDSKAVRRHLAARKTRFVTPEELLELTGLVPGSVPPFGSPVLPLPLYVDESVVENEHIAFNAGSLTDSVVISVKDYLAISRPEIFRFSK